MGTLKSRRLYIDGLTALRNDSLLSNKDLEVLSDRITREGDYIVMHLLPNFARNLELSLELGVFQPLYNNLQRLNKNSNLTCLFKERLLKIFDKNGNILEDVCAKSIADIRQVCYLFHKVVSPFDQATEIASWDKYKLLDSTLPDNLAHLSIRSLTILEYARDFMSKWLNHLSLQDIIPCHGPGASATGLSQRDRRERNNTTFYGGLHERYPYYTWHYSHISDLSTNVALYWAAKSRETIPSSELRLVPKDARGPRIICIEPSEFMWIQKGQMASMYKYCETHPLSKGRVNFTNQRINQDLAKINSISRELGSIDLKDASDRVSLCLVKALFPPHILCDILATRTGHTMYGDERVKIKKYASMGNATTFPVEAIVFYALLQGIRRYYNVVAPAYVYGDDIFFDSSHTKTVSDVFDEFGLKVNPNKTFSTGFFRESCGKDYYKGVDVTPVRVRRLDKDVLTSISTSDSADLMFENGLWSTSRWLDSISYKICPRDFVSSPEDASQGIKKQLFSKSESLYLQNPKKHRTRFDHNHQVTKVRVQVFKALVDTESLGDESDQLLQKFTNGWKSAYNIPDVVNYPEKVVNRVRYVWVQSDGPLTQFHKQRKS